MKQRYHMLFRCPECGKIAHGSMVIGPFDLDYWEDHQSPRCQHCGIGLQIMEMEDGSTEAKVICFMPVKQESEVTL